MRSPGAALSSPSCTTMSPTLLLRILPVVIPQDVGISPRRAISAPRTSHTASSNSPPCRVERAFVEHALALALEHDRDRGFELLQESGGVVRRELSDQRTPLTDVFGQGPGQAAVTAQVSHQHAVELALRLDQALQPLGQRAGRRVEVLPKRRGDLAGHLARVRLQLLLHLADEPLALAP